MVKKMAPNEEIEGKIDGKKKSKTTAQGTAWRWEDTDTILEVN